MIKVSEPEFVEASSDFVTSALSSNQISGTSLYVKRFEEKFAEFIGVEHAIGCANGTVALIQILTAMGIGKDDDVILPSQQISAIALATSAVGATIVIVDVNQKDWTIDIDRLDSVIRENTKAIVATPIYAGVPPNMSDIYRKLRHRWVIEDFSEAIGTRYYDSYVGSIGDVGFCSLYANKNITSGEGGMIVTNDETLAKEIRKVGNCYFGDTPETKLYANMWGCNYRLDGLSAAYGLGQLQERDYLFGRRKEINKWYREYLSPKYIWQEIPDNCDVVPWMEAVLLPSGLHSKDLSEFLRKNQIESRYFFPALGTHDYYRYCKYPMRATSERVSKELCGRGIIFPSSGKNITRRTVEYVCSIANDFLR